MSRYGMWPLWFLGAKVVCCSEYVKSQYLEVPWVPQSVFHTVWNCAKVAQVRQRAEVSRLGRAAIRGGPIAVMVATLERHKDHDTILNAVPTILKSLPGFQLLLVGDGSRRTELENLVKSLGVERSVQFLGTRQDVPEILGSSDLFVLSTTPQEGLGTVMIEALAAGLPVVATDVPACRELLQGGAYGTLVPVGSPSQMAAAIVDKLGSLSSATEDGLAYAMSFTPERMMESYMQIAGERGSRA
ncbi:MAG: glycosyltransferase [Pirellula sp.]